MRTLKSIIAAAVIALSAPAHAITIDQVWAGFSGPGTRTTDWIGNCLTGCTGQAHMQFVSSNPFQTVLSSLFSTPINSYLAVRYTSSVGDFIFTPPEAISPQDLPTGIAPFFFYFFSPAADGLTELADGSWTAKVELTANGPIITSTGTQGIFTPQATVPEPSVLALILLSLFAFAFSRKTPRMPAASVKKIARRLKVMFCGERCFKVIPY